MNEKRTNSRNQQIKMPKSFIKHSDTSYTHFKPIQIVSIKINSNKSKKKGRNLTSNDLTVTPSTKIIIDSMQTQPTDPHIPLIHHCSTQEQKKMVKAIGKQSFRHQKSTSTIPPLQTKIISLTKENRIKEHKAEIQKEKECNRFITKILLSKINKKAHTDKSHLLKLNRKMASLFQRKTKDYSLENIQQKQLLIQTTKINHKLIRDFGIQNKGIQQDIVYSLKNCELADSYLLAKQSLMQNSTKNRIKNFDNIKRNVDYYPEFNTEILDYNRTMYNELYSKITEKEYEKKKKEKEMKTKEKISKKAKKYADLVLELNTKTYGKGEFNNNQPIVAEVEVNYSNLANDIELFNFQNKRLENEEIFDSVNQFIEMKEGNNQVLVSALKHFAFPQFVKKKLRRDTITQFNKLNGVYI